MGLIMLILIGTVPTAYALNHAVTPARRLSNSFSPLRMRVRSSNAHADAKEDTKGPMPASR